MSKILNRRPMDVSHSPLNNKTSAPAIAVDEGVIFDAEKDKKSFGEARYSGCFG